MTDPRLKSYFTKTKRASKTDEAGNYTPSSESELQSAACAWLKKNYPDIHFISTFNGMKLPRGLAAIAQKQTSHRGTPDLLVLYNNTKYPILFLELKKDGTVLINKNGTLRKDDHIADQAEYIYYLRSQGYYADFSIGYVDTIIKLKMYIEGEPVPYLLPNGLF
jgi:hypothetical protein